MEPNLKLLLEEMKSMKSSLEGSITEVKTSLCSCISAVERTLADRFGQLEHTARVFDTWKPTVDASVKELRMEMGEIHKSGDAMEKMREEMMALRKSVSRVVLDTAPSAPFGILPQPLVTTATTATGHPVIGPSVGHGTAQHHRGLESMTLPLVKGTHPQPHPLPMPTFMLHTSFSSSMLDTGRSTPWGRTAHHVMSMHLPRIPTHLVINCLN
jgi:hypothetical protein